ncbi:ATP-binding cassette domain-containing protein [Desulfovibrio ferrophilus]|uniref:ABC transporter related protein n=1 Tax=Desulfovibrio ferrophilus TaxID=241368 RepID=A0A2Z6AXL2_9BACT|nr:ATP-binding cassette domain-containing protein [Desulfovibrio ferrophilus]BBD07945.1 ABC transporter related protein [Desulfovibrio ferrophilus]
MIRLHSVGKHYDNVEVLPHTTLHIQTGKGLCLTGPSGCGKTTLLEIAAGLNPPDCGRIELGSQNIGCVFQDDAIIPWLDAEANITFVLHDKKRLRQRIARYWLRRFDLPPQILPPAMSGGMRRRLNLARAFAVCPDILFLDEPFAFLDSQWQRKLLLLIEESLHKGMTILMASHQLGALRQTLPSLDYQELSATSAQNE